MFTLFRSLRGTQLSGQNGIGLGQSHYNFQSDDRLSHFGVSRFYSTKVLVLSAITATFALVTAMVIMSGYLITCNELHYETRRQVLGRQGNSLGKMIFFVVVFNYLLISNDSIMILWYICHLVSRRCP